jgi:two-component sensor histidine kinase
VLLTWRDIEGCDAPELQIIWQERGGPPVKEPSKSGFGTNVMKFSIERGLRGRIATSFGSGGIRHEVTFPRNGDVAESADDDPLSPEE